MADEELSTSLVPAVLLCQTVDEKNKALYDGVYQYFSHCFGAEQQKQRGRSSQRPDETS